MLLVWCVSVGMNQARAQSGPPQVQFVNGNFETVGSGYCTSGIPYWNLLSAGAAGYPDLEPSGAGKYVNLAGCGGGNGRYIEQKVRTIPNRTYKIKFDLGCWKGYKYTDAGIRLSINGIQQGGRFAHATFTGAPLAWKTFEYCFVATGTTTTVLFKGDGAPTSSSPAGTTAADVREIGIDNVTLISMTRTIDITGRCGDQVNLDSIACGAGTSWGSPDNPNQGYVFTGPYTISRPVSMLGRRSASCCEVLLNIHIEEPDYRFEPLTYDSTGCKYCFMLKEIPGPYTDLEDYGYTIRWYVNGILKPVAAASFCYRFTEHATNEVMVVIEKYDRCGNTFYDTLKKVIRTPQPVVIDGGTYSLNTCGADSAGRNFVPACEWPYTHFKITTSNGRINDSLLQLTGPLFPQPGMKLAPGDYILTCYDDTSCTTMVSRLSVTDAFREYSQAIAISDCSQLTDTAFLMTQVFDIGCRRIIRNHTWAGPWTFFHDTGVGMASGTRTYIDSTQCERCKLLYDYTSYPELYIVNAGNNPCYVFPKANLSPCLQGRGHLKLFIDGYPGEAVAVHPDSIKLCCANTHNMPDPYFVLYTEEDPCCYMSIKLDCTIGHTPSVKPGGNGIAQTEMIPAGLRLVPNPATTAFRIASNHADERYQRVDVLDMNGRLVMTQANLDARSVIDLSKYPAGNYAVSVTTASGSVVLLRLSLVKN